jgi:hypothetical protein
MRTTLARLATLALLLPACSDDTKVTSDGPIVSLDKPQPAAEKQLTDTGRKPDRNLVDSAPAASICGDLADSSGAPIPNGDVIVCIGTETCISGYADANGAFCLGAAQEGEYLFHAPEKKVTGGQHTDADVMFPVTITAGDISSQKKIELGTITKPLITASPAIDPDKGGTVDFGGGAKLTVPASSLVCPAFKDCTSIGFSTVTPTKIHARLLQTRPGAPAGATCSSTGSTDCPVLAYVMTYIDVGFSTNATFVTPTQISASPVTLDAYRVDELTGKLVAKGQVTVTNGQLSASLPALGWWLFYPHK